MRFLSELRADQREASEYLSSHAQALLLSDCGTGKTITTLCAISGKRGPTIVFASASIVRDQVWPREALKWEGVSGLKFVTLIGSPAQRKRLLRGSSCGTVYVCSYDNMHWLLAQEESWRFDVAVFDEVSAMKDTTTARFKTLRKNLERFPVRWGLTATPCSNDLQNIFGCAYVVAAGKPFGNSFPKWRAAYFEQVDYAGYKWAPRHDTEARIYAALAPFTYRVPPGTVKLPPVVEIVRPVELPGPVLVQYRAMERDGLFKLMDAGEITAANAAVATFKLQQILSGAIYEELTEFDFEKNQYVTTRRVHELHNARIDACRALVDELQGQRVVVTYWFEHELTRLKQAFPDALVVGDVATADRWGSGEGRVLLAQTRKVAYGLDWVKTNCCRLIWFTSVWSLELFTQTIGRLQRDGQTSDTVWVWHLATLDSVDGVCATARGLKSTRQASLLAAMEMYRKGAP